MNRQALKWFYCCLSAILFIGCSEMSPEDVGASIVGNYHGNYFDGMETLIIRNDGTFSQTFKVHGSEYSNHGKWRVVKDDILFQPFLFLSRDGKFAPDKVDGFSTSWSLTPGRITMSEDENYYVTKAK